MEPLLATCAGMYLGSQDVLTAANLAPYAKDTLNELESILGDVSTPFGSLCASLGYPNPWKLNYIEIGNEDQLQGGAGSYASYRFSLFYNAIHAFYPNITIISSTGDPTAVGPGSATEYHIYTRLDFFFYVAFQQFDNLPRTNKVPVGKYANVQYNLHNAITGTNWALPRIEYPIWVGAVSEAIFAIGCERNGDVVVGLAYAPAFQNMNSYEWSPDLVSFTADPTQIVFLISYCAIELFSAPAYRIASTVFIISDQPFSLAFFVAGTTSSSTTEAPKYVFKVATYNTTAVVPFNISFEGVRAGAVGKSTVLGETVGDRGVGLGSNRLLNGTVVEVVRREQTELVAGEEGTFEFEWENYCIAVLTVGA